MSRLHQELAWADTPQGLLTLRRRWDPTHQADVYEVKLDDEFLMSSLFTVAEIELARRGLAAAQGDALDVVVGGLGLGYTAAAVLEDPRVRSLTVVDALPEVIAWHEAGLLSTSTRIVNDPRARFVAGDFFAIGDADAGSGDWYRDLTLDAVLVDIDHTPRHLLDPTHGRFYTADGMQRLAGRLRPGGAFALWSDDPPDEEFLTVARTAFATVEAHVVTFANAYTHGESSNTVYVARI